MSKEKAESGENMKMIGSITGFLLCLMRHPEAVRLPKRYV